MIALSYPDLLDYRAQSRSFEALEGAADQEGVLGEPGNPPQAYHLERATFGIFSMLHIHPVLGRDFLPSDAQTSAAPVLMIGYTIWQNRYAGSPSVIGRQVRVNEKPATIIGVMPKGFMFPTIVDLWMPLAPTPNDLKRDNRQLQVFGLLQPGVNIAAAQRRARRHRPSPRRPILRHRQGHQRARHDLPRALQRRQHQNGLHPHARLRRLRAPHRLRQRRQHDAQPRHRPPARDVHPRRPRRFPLARHPPAPHRKRPAQRPRRPRRSRPRLPSASTGSISPPPTSAAPTGCSSPWTTPSSATSPPSASSAACSSASRPLCAPRVPTSTRSCRKARRSVGRLRGGNFSAVLVVFQFALTLVLLTGAGIFVHSLLKSLATNQSIPSDQLMIARIDFPHDRYKDADAIQRFYDQLLPRLQRHPRRLPRRDRLQSSRPRQRRQPTSKSSTPPSTIPPTAPSVSFVVSRRPAILGTIRLPLLARPRLQRPRRHRRPSVRHPHPRCRPALLAQSIRPRQALPPLRRQEQAR